MAKLYFVVHPVKEPPYGRAKRGERIPVRWNIRKPHRRKYMKRHGRYLDGNHLTENDLYFWGEYEAHSDCVLFDEVNAPKAVHDVLYPVRGTDPIPKNALNTDPYVFGNHFKNICCGIRKKNQYSPGDIIVFGRIIDVFFEFDTVFVVEKEVEIDPLRNTTQYYKACIEPLLNQGKSVSYYYQGLPYSNIDHPFSFVPCTLNYSQKDRPKLKLATFGSNVYMQGFQAKAQTVEFDPKLWPIILKAVKTAGWKIGVHIDKI